MNECILGEVKKDGELYCSSSRAIIHDGAVNVSYTCNTSSSCTVRTDFMYVVTHH